MKLWSVLAITICAAVVSTSADAAKKRSKAGMTFVRGCTHYTPPFCTAVTQGGTTYTLFDATPPIPHGVGVDVWGVKGDVSICFGTPLKVVSWKRNGMLCPLN